MGSVTRSSTRDNIIVLCFFIPKKTTSVSESVLNKTTRRDSRALRNVCGSGILTWDNDNGTQHCDTVGEVSFEYESYVYGLRQERVMD